MQPATPPPGPDEQSATVSLAPSGDGDPEVGGTAKGLAQSLKDPLGMAEAAIGALREVLSDATIDLDGQASDDLDESFALAERSFVRMRELLGSPSSPG